MVGTARTVAGATSQAVLLAGYIAFAWSTFQGLAPHLGPISLLVAQHCSGGKLAQTATWLGEFGLQKWPLNCIPLSLPAAALQAEAWRQELLQRSSVTSPRNSRNLADLGGKADGA